MVYSRTNAPLEEIDADEHASILEGGPGKPEELEYAHQQ
jgi:hypothetical protein